MPKPRTSATGAAHLRQPSDGSSELFQTALKQHRAGCFAEAELLYRNVIAQNPNHAFALSNLGVLARRKKRLNEAIALYRRAIQADPSMVSTHSNLGNVLMERGLVEAAKSAFRAALKLNPDHQDARVGLAGALSTAGNTDEALDELRKTLERDPRHLGALEMIGRLLVQARNHEAALPYLERTIELNPRHAGALNNLGCVYSDRGRKVEARSYFERALQADANQAACHLNLGNMVRDLEGPRAAIPHFKRATELNPKYAKAWFNLGSALSRFDANASIRHLHQGLAIQPDHIGALICCLMHSEKLCNFDEATRLHAKLEAALPSQLDSYEDWSILGNITYNFIFRPMSRELMTRVTSRADELLTQLRSNHGPLAPLPPPVAKGPQARLRIGYISPNFRDHPVGHVTLSLFRLQDRQRFEIHAFSTDYANPGANPYAVEHRKGFDAFHEIGKLTPRDAAQAIRDAQIDILVDLDGYMDNKSPPILAFRPAPIQVYWLGHAGGLGLSCIDYLIADATVVPPGEEAHYRESIVRMPDVYHCADRAPIAAEAALRSEFGLPETGFVFCAFNNPQKLDATVFDCWMRILKRVDGSCLWLSNPRDAQEMVDNLRARAQAAGVASERIVFTSRVPDKAVHLARHRLAGLFLDTLTLNASTTALDALWSGVPLLTISGKHFASRIASTMLRGLGLDELITNDLSEYEQRAVEYALVPAKLAEVTRRLAEARQTQPLFDTERFVRHLEHAFERMWETHVRGEPVRGFDLPAERARLTPAIDASAPPRPEASELVQLAAAADAPPLPTEGQESLRLHIGGRQVKAGWKILNVQPGPNVDYVGNCTDLGMFADDTVDEIYASHVYEHLGFRTELPHALREAWRVLKPTGVLRVSVPDLECLCRLFVNPQVPREQRFSLMMHLFGAQEDAYDVHRVGLTEDFLSHFLSKAGFVRLRRVKEFGMFEDYSSFRRFGVLISLNFEAHKT